MLAGKLLFDLNNSSFLIGNGLEQEASLVQNISTEIDKVATQFLRQGSITDYFAPILITLVLNSFFDII